MKKRFIAVVALLLAFVMSFALIACGDDGKGNTEKQPDMAKAVKRLIESDAFEGELGYSLSSSVRGTKAMDADVEKSGSKLKLIEHDGDATKETIVDIVTGYAYSKVENGYVYKQSMYADTVNYAEYMLAKQLEKIDTSDTAGNGQKLPSVTFDYDKSTRTATLAYDDAEKINTYLAPLYSAYKSNANLYTMINNYLKLVSPDPATPYTLDTVLTMLIRFIKVNPNMTVGYVIDYASRNGIDVYDLLESSGLLSRLGITLDAEKKAAIENRKVADMIVGAYRLFKELVPVAASQDDGTTDDAPSDTGNRLDANAVFNAMFVTPVESENIGEELDDVKNWIMAATMVVKVRDTVDKYLGKVTATPQMREVYAVIKNQVVFEKFEAKLAVKYDKNDNIQSVKAEARFKHDYDGDTTGFTVLSDNNYELLFDLTVNEYSSNSNDFVIEFAPEARMQSRVGALAYGTFTGEKSVYFETGGKNTELTSLSPFMKYDGENHLFVFDFEGIEQFYQDEIQAGTFDGFVVGTALVVGTDDTVTVVLRMMPDDIKGLLSLAGELWGNGMGA